MSDALPSTRSEPPFQPLPMGVPAQPVAPVSEPEIVVPGIVVPKVTVPEVVVPEIASPEPAARPAPGSHDRLARIEDKAARIEEKFARSETLMLRVVDKVELATARMGEVAGQADLAAVRGEVALIARRVGGLPGVAALVVTGLLTSVATAILVILLVRYLPGLVAR